MGLVLREGKELLMSEVLFESESFLFDDECWFWNLWYSKKLVESLDGDLVLVEIN